MNVAAPVLGVYGVNVAFSEKQVLRDVSFELHRSEFMALLGPNGSGKSTLLKAVAGILNVHSGPSSGIIRYNGSNFQSQPTALKATQVVYVGSDLSVEFPLTGFEAVMLGRTAYHGTFLARNSSLDREMVLWAMDKCCCARLADRDVQSLSGGERQLILLARALAQGAKVLLLDETLSRMDLHHQVSVGKMLKNLCEKNGLSIVLVAHDVNLASEWAVTCMLLNGGNSVGFGPIQEILTLDRIRALYPSADLRVVPSPISGAPKVFFS